jgi:antibiotic biosynthesis monooxygenase (ABM) superfamily enzyme
VSISGGGFRLTPASGSSPRSSHISKEAMQVEIRTGLEFWFTPPDSGQKHAKTYKQFLITWSVIFPLTIFVPWVLHPLFQTVPFLGLPGISNLLISAMIVGLLTYVIMPRYTRMVATWLYRRIL